MPLNSDRIATYSRAAHIASRLIVDETTGGSSDGDADKTLTVSTGKDWEIRHIWVELASSTQAGNRQLQLEIQDTANDIIGGIAVGAVQAASLTRNYMFYPGAGDLTAFRATDELTTPIPPNWVLKPGYQVRLYDSAGVGTTLARDEIIIQMLVGERNAASTATT